VKFDLILPRPLRTGAVVLATLAAAGWALRPVEQPAWEELGRNEPALRLDSFAGALGQGVTVGLLGGFRAIVADFFFIKASADWENEDLPATVTGLKLTTVMDPRPLFFWIHGAYMMAYDMPNWRIAAEGGLTVVPQARQRAIDREQAAMGLALLEEALRYHPHAPEIYMEMAGIHLYRLSYNKTDEAEVAAAAEYYGRAAAQPRAPFVAARIQANLLADLGRLREAYDVLVKVYPTLPKNPEDPGYASMPVKNPPPSEEVVWAAAAGDVLGRIRNLEKQLGIPPEKAFRP
jgi:hypothetical protein